MQACVCRPFSVRFRADSNFCVSNCMLTAQAREGTCHAGTSGGQTVAMGMHILVALAGEVGLPVNDISDQSRVGRQARASKLAVFVMRRRR
jgi:hypothetical protein